MAKRISIALDADALARLEQLALDNQRSVASMAAVLLGVALFPGGRLMQAKADRRGGKRQGAGRKKTNQDN